MTVFSSNNVLKKNVLYEQIDGVSMGGSLGPVLANIIMTEFENIVIRKLKDSELSSSTVDTLTIHFSLSSRIH